MCVQVKKNEKSDSFFIFMMKKIKEEKTVFNEIEREKWIDDVYTKTTSTQKMKSCLGFAESLSTIISSCFVYKLFGWYPKKKWIRKTKQKDAQQHLIFVVVIKSRRHKVRSSLNARRNKKKKIIPKNVQLRERNKIENKEREIHRGLGWDVGARAIHAGNGQMVGHHFFFSTVS